MTSPTIHEDIPVDRINLFPGQTLTLDASVGEYGTPSQYEGSQQIEVRILKDGTIEIWTDPEKVRIKSWQSDTWQPVDAAETEIASLRAELEQTRQQQRLALHDLEGQARGSVAAPTAAHQALSGRSLSLAQATIAQRDATIAALEEAAQIAEGWDFGAQIAADIRERAAQTELEENLKLGDEAKAMAMYGATSDDLHVCGMCDGTGYVA